MEQPSVAVLGGTGQQGRGIAQRLALAGFPVIVGSRDPHRAAAVVSGWPGAAGAIATTGYDEAIAHAEIVVLAVPFQAVGSMLEKLQQQFRPQSLVVDVTVPLSFGDGGAALQMVPEGSAAEHVRARLPQHVEFAATFKTIPAHLLDDIEQSLDCDEFVCGDTAHARSQASALVEAMRGLRAIDLGPIARARSIEHLTLLAIGINRRHKVRNARFKVIGL